jgi:hypothetical protein
MAAVPRVAVVAALLAAFASAGPATAATRGIPFSPVAAPAAGTCPVGDAAAYRVELAASDRARAALSPCVGTASPAGPLLLVAAPDETQTGTALRIVRVAVRGCGRQRHLRITVQVGRAPAAAPALQALTTPRAVVRLRRSAVPRAFVLVDAAGAVLARGRA